MPENMSATHLPVAIQWQPAGFWHWQGQRIACDLCPLRCGLLDGETGRCDVRRRTGNTLETATFASSVWHWQSVERKPLYHFRPGLRTLTLAAPGCNFRCNYCQNAVLSQFGKDPLVPWSAKPIIPTTVVEAAHEAGVAIAISYTEPTLAAELTQALAQAVQGRDIPLIWKSNGFITKQALHRIAPLLSAINIDLKAADETSHRWLTGVALAPVLAAARAYKSLGVWVEISTPLINGLNTSLEQIRQMASMVASVGLDVPWHLIRVLPDYRMRSLMPTSPSLLKQAIKIGYEAGLRHVYVERATGAADRQTNCPNCGAIVIDRDIGALAQNYLIDGNCPVCNECISGVWNGAKKHYG